MSVLLLMLIMIVKMKLTIYKKTNTYCNKISLVDNRKGISVINFLKLKNYKEYQALFLKYIYIKEGKRYER